MDELTKHRWKKDTNPASHQPRTALEAASERLADLDAPPVTHVVVVFCTDEGNGGVGQGYFQAGSLGGTYATVGLLTSVSAMILEDR